jgi:microcystin degradation protein MlrC
MNEGRARMIRIAIGGLMHESNTFAAGRTDVAAFVAGGLETGDGIHARWGEAHHEVGGFFDGARQFGFDAVPTLMGTATPAGPLTAEAYGDLSDRLLAAIAGAGLVDAVLLALHGAMVAEGEPDADGALLERVRSLIGRDRPLVVSLDYHANVSPRMAAAADALVAYRTYPHVDQRLRGRRAAALAAQAASGRVHPTQALSKPPLLINILAQETGVEPLRSLLQGLDELEDTHSYLDASILAGFPYADVPEAGPACVVVTDDAPELASETAERLSARIWQFRHDLTATPPGPEEAVRRALACRETPVVLVDLGDNVGGGSAADSTVLIQELIRQGATAAIVVLHDPEAVRACAAAGVGEDVAVDAGGKIDRHAPPLHLRGRVRCLHDGRYVETEPRHGGSRINDQGLTAVVDTAGANTVVLNTRRHPPFSLGQLTSLGLVPQAARFLVVKAAVAYKAAYAPIARTIIPVDTPGLTAVNPARYVYHKIRRPILPLDPEPLVEVTLR